MTRLIPLAELRGRFAASLSAMYGREVPAYRTLVEMTRCVNDEALRHCGQRRDESHRVHVERHGAIRVGSPAELATVARIYAGLGMHPVGFYDLRDSGVPVVSTAFRPIDQDDLAANPFRVFTSMLALDDRTYFSDDLARRTQSYLARRQLFPPAALSIADRAAAEGGLEEADAAHFMALVCDAFRLKTDPIDKAWYAELETVSAVAADIAGVSTTHINHLTPRVLDIDELWHRMRDRGLEMIPEIQGPPRWEGPDVLLRQTSFKALSEERTFRDPDGSTARGRLRVRFGEVESRGIALTPSGLDVYKAALAETDQRCAETPGAHRPRVLREVWEQAFPHSESELFRRGLGVFTVAPVSGKRPDGQVPSRSIVDLLDAGFVTAHPVVYEDFLPRSAAGIFRSNLDDDPQDASKWSDLYTFARLEGDLEKRLHDPNQLYRQQHEQSVEKAMTALAMQGVPV